MGIFGAGNWFSMLGVVRLVQPVYFLGRFGGECYFQMLQKWWQRIQARCMTLEVVMLAQIQKCCFVVCATGIAGIVDRVVPKIERYFLLG